MSPGAALELGTTPWLLEHDGSAAALAEQGELAERLGYGSFWLPEHHFGEAGAIPAPLLLLAAVAARTSRLQKDFADAGQIDFVDDIDSVGLKLRTFADRVRTASYGYSGFFDAVKVNEKELEKIYTFDMAFFELANQINSGLDNVEAAIGSDGLKAAIRAVNDLARQANETFDKRYEVITGSAES